MNIQYFTRLRKQLIVALVVVMAALSLAVAVPALAGAQSPQQQACEALGNVWDAGSSTCGTGEAELNSTVSRVIELFSVIVGIAAVIMIIVGGFLYVTSGGDSNKVAAAKHTIIYAIIGLVIAVVAQIIVRFVIGQTA